MSRRDEPLVRVASAGNQALGEMWREVLANNGIPALLRVAGPLTGYATFASAHDLFVAAANAERARELLAAYNEDEGDLSLGRGDEDDENDDRPGEADARRGR
jgi:hypothetical protein